MVLIVDSGAINVIVAITSVLSAKSARYLASPCQRTNSGEKRLIMAIEHGRKMAREWPKSFIVSSSQLMCRTKILSRSGWSFRLMHDVVAIANNNFHFTYHVGCLPCVRATKTVLNSEAIQLPSEP